MDDRDDAPASAAAALPPLAPRRELTKGAPLNSYVSEPPSTLAMMRTYAQELQQSQDQQGAAQQSQTPAGGQANNTAAPAPGGGAIELPPLSLMGKKSPLSRPPHFPLTPRSRRNAAGEAGSGAGSPAFSKLRSSIGGQRLAGFARNFIYSKCG
jgi:hypothetical protein